MDDLKSGIDTLLYVAIVAGLAPFVVDLLPGHWIPQVVVLILGGILIGPQALGWADPQAIELFSDVGLGFVFLLAGQELEVAMFRERAGRLALIAWGISVALALIVVGILDATGVVRAFVPISIALTTTALGTLLPILRDNNMLAGTFGRYVIAAGATGELLPIVAIAIFLGTTSSVAAIVSLIVIGGLALLFTQVPRLIRGRRVERVLLAGEGATSQTTLRWTVVLLLALLAFAAREGLDIVLGAFLAGIVLRQWAPGNVRSLEEKLDAIGYGFFIPVFFVYSGMTLNVRSIVDAPLRLVLFFVLLLAVRGLPALLVYRRALTPLERTQMMFITATTLPLLVALTQIGLANGTMFPENAAALVGAGVLSVVAYPAAAVAVGARRSSSVSY